MAKITLSIVSALSARYHAFVVSVDEHAVILTEQEAPA
jgi:hypothetical protein